LFKGEAVKRNANGLIHRGLKHHPFEDHFGGFGRGEQFGDQVVYPFSVPVNDINVDSLFGFG
jgi:hypothetical protein